MPDRYWWGWALAAAVAIVVGMTAAVGWLLQMLPLDEEIGDSITGDVIAAGAILVVAIGVALVLTGIAFRSHARFHRRHVALKGNAEVMPLAALAPNPAKAPDVSSEPLVLSWRATTSMRTVGAPLYVLLMLCYLAMALVPLGGLIFGVMSQPDWAHNLTGAAVLIIIITSGASVAALALIAVFFGYMPTLFGRPYGVTATADGLECQTQFGRRCALRWEDACLFEATGRKSVASARSYYVYGPRGVISWQDSPAKYNEFAPNGMTSGEMALRLEAMVNLVVARTGLQPRTFSSTLIAKAGQPQASVASLQVATAHVPRSDAKLRRSNVVSYLCLGAFTAGMAAAVLALKPAAFVPLNAGIAVSLILLALLCMGAGMRLLLRRPNRAEASAHLPAVPAVAPPAMTPITVFQLQVAIGPLVRIILAILGLFLCLDLAPAIMVLPRLFLQGELPSGLPSVGDVLQVILSFLLLFYGFGGLGFLFAAASNRKRVIRADGLGLSVSPGVVPQALAWDDIELVVAYTDRDTIATYAARGKDGSVTISWPAHSSLAQRVETGISSPSVSPDELAALVSLRSGKPIEARGAR